MTQQSSGHDLSDFTRVKQVEAITRKPSHMVFQVTKQ